MSELKIGLDGVQVARTRMSKVLGEEGKLIYAGYDIHDVAEHASFEEVAYMFWYWRLPNSRELTAFGDSLKMRRNLPFHVLELIRSAPTVEAHPMSVLRTAVSALALGDPGSNDISSGSNLRRAADLTAKIPAIIAAHDRHRKELETVGPRDDLDHASNFLYMLNGRVPSELEARALNLYLVLLADHGFNASTFSARCHRCHPIGYLLFRNQCHRNAQRPRPRRCHRGHYAAVLRNRQRGQCCALVQAGTR